MGCNASNAKKDSKLAKRPGQAKTPGKPNAMAKKTMGGGPADKNIAKRSEAPADTLAKPESKVVTNADAVKSEAKAEADAKKAEPKKPVASASEEDSEDDDSASESSDADENDSSEQSSDLESEGK